MKIVRSFLFRSLYGFTMIELMIAVAIIAVLSAVAIPIYQSYIRRSYLNEATTSISTIKSAEESFFTINSCYVNAIAWPASVPQGTTTAWNTGLSTTSAWSSAALGVRPDRNVRFQYQVYASNALNTTTMGCGTAVANTAIPAQGCVSQATIQNTLVNTVVLGTNWYLVVARGDLDGDGVASNIVSAIDDSTVIMCDELE